MTHEKRKLRNSLLISIDDLRVGMFVAELDRPWAQTPFMLQGFLLSEVLDCQTLQGMVRALTIDPSRSDPSALLHLPWDILHEPAVDEEPEPQASGVRVTYVAPPSAVDAAPILLRARQGMTELAGIFSKAPQTTRPVRRNTENSAQLLPRVQPTPYFLRYASDGPALEPTNKAERSSQLTPPSTRHFSEFIEKLYPRDVVYAPLSWLEKTQDWLRKLSKASSYRSSRTRKTFPVRRRRPDYVPPSVNLVIYKDRAPMQEEIQHARVAVEKTQEFLAKLTDDIQQGQELELEQMRPAVQLLTESVIANPSALMWLVRMQDKDSETYAHGLKVAVYMMALGRHLGFARQQLNDLGLIGLLLDIGKLNLPDELIKKADKLSDEEHALMRSHVDSGLAKLQKNEPLSQNVFLGISQHHERLDGSGYPLGLKGAAISIFGRMAAIADSFAAMTSDRSYDSTRSAFDAMQELFKEAGKKLHATLVEEFVQAIGIFPVGSMIELSSGEVAIVLEHNKLRRLEPKILVLTNSEKEKVERPWVLNLMNQIELVENSRVRILRGLPDGAYGIDGRSVYQA